MAKSKGTGAARTEVPRWLRVKVTREDIGHAIMAKSTGCAISDAVARQYPDLKSPVTDIRSVKVSFPELGQRAEYKMTVSGALFIVRFDRGDRNLDGFELRLPLAAHTPMRSVASKAEARDRTARSRARKKKIATGEALSREEKVAERNYKGAEPVISEGPRSFTPGPTGFVQEGGRLSPVAPGASGPSIPLPENTWGQSGASTSRGKRPKFYRGYGVNQLGGLDPAVIETAGETYEPGENNLT